MSKPFNPPTGASFSGIEVASIAAVARLTHQSASFRNCEIEPCTLFSLDLTGCDFENSVLIGVTFEDCNISDANFLGANMTDTSLETVQGLTLPQLSGANLTRCKLPPYLSLTEDQPSLSDLGKSTMSIFITLAGSCFYVLLTSLSTSDVQLVSRRGTSTMPVLSVSVGTGTFLMVAPLVLAAIAVLLYINIGRGMSLLAKLPAVFPDGSHASSVPYPWLLLDTGQVFSGRTTNRRPWKAFPVLSLYGLLAYYLVPFTMVIIRFRLFVLDRYELSLSRISNQTLHIHERPLIPIVMIYVAVAFGWSTGAFVTALSALKTRSYDPSKLPKLFSHCAHWRGIWAGLLVLICMLTMLYAQSDYLCLSPISPINDRQLDAVMDVERRRSLITEQVISAQFIAPELVDRLAHWQMTLDPLTKNIDRRNKPYSIATCFGLATDIPNFERDETLKPATWKLPDNVLYVAGFAGRESTTASALNGLGSSEDQKLNMEITDEMSRLKATQDLNAALPPASFVGDPAAIDSLVEAADTTFQNERKSDQVGHVPQYMPQGVTADLRYLRAANSFLINVDFRGATLCGADFSTANLIGAKWSQLSDNDSQVALAANVVGAIFKGAELSNSEFAGVNGSFADFNDSDLTNADLRQGTFLGANFEGAKMIGTHLWKCILVGAKLQGAWLVKADVNGAYLECADLSGADMRGANFYETDLRSADISSVNFSGAKNLAFARMDGCFCDQSITWPKDGMPRGYWMDAKLTPLEKKQHPNATFKLIPSS